MDFVGDGGHDCEQRWVGDERGEGNGHDHGHIGDNPRVRRADCNGGGTDLDCGDTGDTVGTGRREAAIYCDGDLQQRDDANSDQHCDVDFVGDDDRNREQRRTGDERESGQHDDHGHFGNDHRLSHVGGDGCSVDIDCGDTGGTVGGGRPYGAIYRHWNL